MKMGKFLHLPNQGFAQGGKFLGKDEWLVLWEQQKAGTQANYAGVRCYVCEGEQGVQYSNGRRHARCGIGGYAMFSRPERIESGGFGCLRKVHKCLWVDGRSRVDSCKTELQTIGLCYLLQEARKYVIKRSRA